MIIINDIFQKRDIFGFFVDSRTVPPKSERMVITHTHTHGRCFVTNRVPVNFFSVLPTNDKIDSVTKSSYPLRLNLTFFSFTLKKFKLSGSSTRSPIDASNNGVTE